MNGFDTIREECHLTLDDIAQMLQIKKQSVSDWSNRGIPAKRISELSKCTGIDEKYFLLEQTTDVDRHAIAQQRRNYELEMALRENEIIEQAQKVNVLYKGFVKDEESLKNYKSTFRIKTLLNLNGIEKYILECFDSDDCIDIENANTNLWKNLYHLTKTFLEQIKDEHINDLLRATVSLDVVLSGLEVEKEILDKSLEHEENKLDSF